MKNLIFLVTSIILLSGCNEVTKKVERTAQTPSKVQMQIQVPLSKEAYDCNPVTVYGPDSSCGMGEYVTTCSYDALNGHDICSKEHVSPSCMHTEDNCKYRKRPPLVVTAEIIFDENSMLSSDQKETYTFKANIVGNDLVVKTAVKSKYHTYSFPRQIVKNVYQMMSSNEVQTIEFKKID